MPSPSAPEVIWAAIAEAVAPRRTRSPAMWAEESRTLPRGTSHRYGRWRNEAAPYLVEVMDALSSAPEWEWAQIVAVNKPAQGAGTEGLLNWIGVTIEDDPTPMLIVYPTVAAARRFSRRRLTPMIESSPTLKALVRSARSRDSGNTTLMKEFDGGALILTGANAPQELAGEPIGKAAMDDADRAPGEVGEEGDPLKLIWARMTTFPNRKLLIQSTTTIENESRVESVWLQSDQRRFFVPCPTCGHFDYLTWQGYGNFKDQEDPGHFEVVFDDKHPDPPSTVRLRCGCHGRPESACACCAEIPESQKPWMVTRGRWQPTAPGDGKTAGFHWNAIYSLLGPSLGELVGEFMAAKNDPIALREFLNLRLAESYRRDHITIKPRKLLARAEPWLAEVPDGVGALVGVTDVQPAWLANMVLGFGVGEECWIIDYEELDGDPTKPAVWKKLDHRRAVTYTHESGQEVPVDRWGIDSGGHNTDEVYDYVRPRASERVVAIRGGNDPTAELVNKSSRKNKGGIRLWTLGVDNGKDTLYERLKVETPGPGMIHLPRPDPETGRWLWVNAEFAAGLASEVPKRKRGRRGWTREWKTVRERNEPWDLLNYGLAMFRMPTEPRLWRDIARRVERLREKPTERASAKPERAPPRPHQAFVPRRRGWMRRS